MNKQLHLNFAEVLDSYRVFPRLFLLSCFLWTVWVTHALLKWYMAMPKDERSLEASGLASVVFLTIFGFLKMVYDTYSKAGRDWNSTPGSTTSTVVATTTETKP